MWTLAPTVYIIDDKEGNIKTSRAYSARMKAIHMIFSNNSHIFPVYVRNLLYDQIHFSGNSVLFGLSPCRRFVGVYFRLLMQEKKKTSC